MKQTRSFLVKSFLGLMALTLASSIVPTAARADAYGPQIDAYNPSYDGDQVISLKANDTSVSNPYSANPVGGYLRDADGINRVTIVIKRGTDGAYWTGNNWAFGSTGFLANVTVTSGVYSFRAPNGPPANGIAAGVNYLLQIEAVDTLGNRTLLQRTFVGRDE